MQQCKRILLFCEHIGNLIFWVICNKQINVSSKLTIMISRVACFLHINCYNKTVVCHIMVNKNMEKPDTNFISN